MKNMHAYTDKFSLHVIDLECIDLATEEDKAYQTDVWAAFFKAKTWEEMRMLAERKPGLQSSVETLYQLNCDEQIRETLDRFVRAQRREQGYLDTISSLEQENAALRAELEALRAQK